jgi:hypothetical protein
MMAAHGRRIKNSGTGTNADSILNLVKELATICESAQSTRTDSLPPPLISLPSIASQQYEYINNANFSPFGSNFRLKSFVFRMYRRHTKSIELAENWGCPPKN